MLTVNSVIARFRVTGRQRACISLILVTKVTLRRARARTHAHVNILHYYDHLHYYYYYYYHYYHYYYSYNNNNNYYYYYYVYYADADDCTINVVSWITCLHHWRYVSEKCHSHTDHVHIELGS